MSRIERCLRCLSAGCLVLALAGCSGRPGDEAAVTKDKNPTGTYDGELIITPPALQGFIKIYCNDQSKKNGGFMVVHDEAANTDLKLKLDSVRPLDPQPETSPGHYYVCADMKDEQGAAYDVDFVYKKTSRGMEISDVFVHKDPEKARYDWVPSKESRFWVRQPPG